MDLKKSSFTDLLELESLDDFVGFDTVSILRGEQEINKHTNDPFYLGKIGHANDAFIDGMHSVFSNTHIEYQVLKDISNIICDSRAHTLFIVRDAIYDVLPPRHHRPGNLKNELLGSHISLTTKQFFLDEQTICCTGGLRRNVSCSVDDVCISGMKQWSFRTLFDVVPGPLT